MVPKFSALKPGDTIGVIALSSACAPDALKRGVAALKQMGFKVKVVLSPARYYDKKKFLFSSDSPQKRAHALEKLFQDKEVKAIIAARGAYGAMEVLPFFNFKVAARNPKPLVGFSDTTAFLVAISQLAKTPTVHGPSVTGAFAQSDSDRNHARSARSTIKLLSAAESNPFSGRSFKNLSRAKSGQGELVGGSLTMLCAMLGTPWEVKSRGRILFIEECGERPYRVLRMLTSLKLACKLDGLKGVLLGSFKDCVHQSGPTVEEVLRSQFKDAKYPVLSGLPFGHDTLNLPLPLGAQAQIDNGKIKIISALFKRARSA